MEDKENIYTVDNVKVTAANLMVKSLQKENERDGVIIDNTEDVFLAEVVAVGYQVDDIKIGDIVASPKMSKIKTYVGGELYYLIDYRRVLHFFSKSYKTKQLCQE